MNIAYALGPTGHQRQHGGGLGSPPGATCTTASGAPGRPMCAAWCSNTRTTASDTAPRTRGRLRGLVRRTGCNGGFRAFALQGAGPAPSPSSGAPLPASRLSTPDPIMIAETSASRAGAARQSGSPRLTLTSPGSPRPESHPVVATRRRPSPARPTGGTTPPRLALDAHRAKRWPAGHDSEGESGSAGPGAGSQRGLRRRPGAGGLPFLAYDRWRGAPAVPGAPATSWKASLVVGVVGYYQPPGISPAQACSILLPRGRKVVRLNRGRTAPLCHLGG